MNAKTEQMIALADRIRKNYDLKLHRDEENFSSLTHETLARKAAKLEQAKDAYQSIVVAYFAERAMTKGMMNGIMTLSLQVQAFPQDLAKSILEDVVVQAEELLEKYEEVEDTLGKTEEPQA
jgi:hypothetical protein